MCQGRLSKIRPGKELYVGGYRNVSLVGWRAGVQRGFVGCVGRLVINGRVIDMRADPFVGDALHGVDVREYICASTQCSLSLPSQRVVL